MRSKTSEPQMDPREGCIALLLFLLSWPLFMVWGAWVVTLLWGWFVVPTFHVAPLTLPQAAGLGLLALWYQSRYQRTDTDPDLIGTFFKTLAYRALATVMVLGMGLVVRLFM